jgi:hypothetical protein
MNGVEAGNFVESRKDNSNIDYAIQSGVIG